MPHAIVASDTYLMTGVGWARAGRLQIDTVVYGTDRHGHLVAKRIRSKPVDPGPIALIGTDASFGLFSARSCLVTKDGISVKVANIVENERLDDFWFETVVALPKATDPRSFPEAYFATLKDTAYVSIKGAPAFRCRSRDVLEWEKASRFECCRLSKVMSEVFCVIDATHVESIGHKDWQGFVRDVCLALFHNSEESRQEFDIDASGPCLWYLSALDRLGDRPEVSYDSLQHTVIGKITNATEHKSPVRTCRCAFYLEQTAQTLLVEWDGEGWAPVAAGFLIASA
jgi:hypothetical protein